METIWYGHASFAVNVNGSSILFDPFISPNPKATAAGVDMNTIRPDYILVSHGHADHIADVLEIAESSGAVVVSNFEIINWLTARGLKNGHAMNLGGQWKFPFGTVMSTVAAHSSSLPDGAYGGEPGGFLIESSAGNFYYSGDTALIPDMELLGRFHQIDWAALCIGDNFTMGVRDAVRAATMLNVKDVFGVHYDTFPPIEIDGQSAVLDFAEAGITLHLPRINEPFQLPGKK